MKGHSLTTRNVMKLVRDVVDKYTDDSNHCWYFAYVFTSPNHRTNIGDKGENLDKHFSILNFLD